MCLVSTGKCVSSPPPYLLLCHNTGRCIRRGIHDLKVWPGVVADGNLKTSTPGKPEDKSISEMIRLTKVVKYSNRAVREHVYIAY